MRETRIAQTSIFDRYAEHEYGRQLEQLSLLLDDHPEILELIGRDFDKADVARTGACGLSIESIFLWSGAQTDHAAELPEARVPPV
mgnify:CR=1 FL=1